MPVANDLRDKAMSTAQEKILIVDDEPNVRKSIARVLRSEGWQIMEAVDGTAALELMQQIDFNLVISDLRMPRMNGVEFLAIASKTHPNSAQIMLSGHARPADLENIINQCKVIQFMEKPWMPAELQEKARQIVAANVDQRRQQHASQMMVGEVNMAAKLQLASLPKPIRAENLQVDWIFRACTTLGGDGLGYRIVEDRLDFYMVDVVGHGVAAALESFSLQQILATSDMRQPELVAQKMNRDHVNKGDGMHYFTLLCGSLDLKTHSLTFCQAGHPSPVVLQNHQLTTPGGGGFPIGLLAEADYQAQTVQLAAGDSLLLHSDGFADEVTADLADLLINCSQRRAVRLATDDTKTVCLATSAKERLLEWRTQQPIHDDVSALIIGI